MQVKFLRFVASLFAISLYFAFASSQPAGSQNDQSFIWPPTYVWEEGMPSRGDSELQNDLAQSNTLDYHGQTPPDYSQTHPSQWNALDYHGQTPSDYSSTHPSQWNALDYHGQTPSDYSQTHPSQWNTFDYHGQTPPDYVQTHLAHESTLDDYQQPHHHTSLPYHELDSTFDHHHQVPQDYSLPHFAHVDNSGFHQQPQPYNSQLGTQYHAHQLDDPQYTIEKSQFDPKVSQDLQQPQEPFPSKGLARSPSWTLYDAFKQFEQGSQGSGASSSSPISEQEVVDNRIENNRGQASAAAFAATRIRKKDFSRQVSWKSAVSGDKRFMPTEASYWSSHVDWTPETLEVFNRLFYDPQRYDEPDYLRRLPWTLPPMLKEVGRRTVHEYHGPDDVRKMINSKIFAGKLEWIPKSAIPSWANGKMGQHALLPSRVLPHIEPLEYRLRFGGGVINHIRMTVHGGNAWPGWPETESWLKMKTLWNFWGVPEGREKRGERLLLHFGTGYLKDKEDIQAVDEHLKGLELAEQAAHVHG
uniref:Effector family protein Eff1 n=1 Tax=Melanopsichium pennsylvanicum 4 TaxID=1398559 RepID=A0A077R2Y0_9BASI|nr:uncharacterized protein BN887_05658 [Melanopsichium pennsylvanicum 4]